LKRAAELFTGGDISNLKVHIIVHNAAIVDDKMLEAETIESINAVLNINGASPRDLDIFFLPLPFLVRGPFLITQALRPYIPSNDNARIIAISSIAARVNVPGTSIYAGEQLSLFGRVIGV
jgi:NAD(P)-dependent dehydrogenase (short-subunit alcohol dehydrogenase family)